MGRGIDTYRGLAAPLNGNFNLKQLSTVNAAEASSDFVTLTHSSGNLGNFLVLRDLPTSVEGGEESTVIASDLLRMNAGGGIAGVSTVSGDNIISGMRRTVTTVATGTTIVSPGSADSGTIYHFIGVVAERSLALPANPTRGDFYDVIMDSSQAASSDLIITTSNDSSADIWMVNIGDGLVSTVQAIQPSTEPGARVTLTALSSIRWMADAPPYFASSYTSAVFTTNTFGNLWSSATSIA